MPNQLAQLAESAEYHIAIASRQLVSLEPDVAQAILSLAYACVFLTQAIALIAAKIEPVGS